MRTMADVIAFNDAHAKTALRFGQDLFLAAEATRGDLSEPEYRTARAIDLRSSGVLGLDAYMEAHQLDAVLFAGRDGAAIAAKAGYPSVQVPAGFTAGFNDKDTPDYPFGATFTGRAWSNQPCSVLPTPSSRRPRRVVRQQAMPPDEPKHFGPGWSAGANRSYCALGCVSSSSKIRRTSRTASGFD